MKKVNERAITRVVIATGISSVVTQLLTIREFISRFSGNEIVIALILFNWLILGGIGTLAARTFSRHTRRPTPNMLAALSLLLSIFAVLQILAIRMLRDLIFIPGSSVGFYPTLLFCFITLAPYCLLLGFVLPYSLFVLRADKKNYPAARIYISDNIGDVAGGVLFSFILVFLVSPLTALFLSHLPLLLSIYLLFSPAYRKSPLVMSAIALVIVIMGCGMGLEKVLLTPAEGKLALYRETRYGRITVHQDREQYTLFENGVPMFSSHNLSVAEETIHYPLSQLDTAQQVLLISARGGVMNELEKYQVQSVDYVELDPDIADIQFRFGIIKKIRGLNVIHEDGRSYLARSKKQYDAIIVNLPEPSTFQLNRFYTEAFFGMAARHLSKDGVLSFSMRGFDNYLAEPQRQKLSSLYNTAGIHFKNVLLLPGRNVFFLCRNSRLNVDIPAALKHKGITAPYINGFFYGNLTPERISGLNDRMDPSTPRNVDNSPFLMRLMFSQWFAKFQTSPSSFFLLITVISVIYMFRIKREEFVLFSTGGMAMGCEILVIFAFQIYFGYIYFQIGIIITLFLAGLLPGAWLGSRLCRQGRRILVISDVFLIVAPALFILAVYNFANHLPAAFYLMFGFLVSLACGFQFPVAVYLRGNDNSAATRSFSADLVGAAFGTVLTSIILIPYLGIIWTAGGLIALKLASLILIGSSRVSMEN